ncbi:uncharacterized protein N7515_007324 [Penicillium bovifimosum]|uniref:HTH CENPB-type domain-containing protein n=1 Tax=Penicillium bovifimosum TaxID=126998 RepID=A0A9W9L1Z4_9EURO|nr:uncharacterized protein N7515_007324 [Penicillium bovifimosum]KAJ5131285.1 hypothetical protein N7515_007324 [Penicillium bovifimosum]
MAVKSQDLEARILAAVSAYHDSKKKLVITKLAREYNIPYNPLKGRIRGRTSRSQRTGPNKALLPDQEQALMHWIDTLNQANSPPTADMIQACANEISRRKDPARTFGRNWAYRFIKRLPATYNYIKQKPMEKDRLEAVTPGQIEDPDLPEQVLEMWDGDDPPPASSSIPNSPIKDVISLRQEAEEMLKITDVIGTELDALSPKFRRELATILEGGLALAEAGAQYATATCQHQHPQPSTTKGCKYNQEEG